MWEPEFSNKNLWKKELHPNTDFVSGLHIDEVAQTLLVYWREHCLECAPPECYHSCPLYEEREDKRCVRVKYGIYPNKAYKGMFEFGADVRFKRWARLGTMLYPVMLSPDQHRFFQKIDRIAAGLVRTAFALTNPFNPNQWFKIRYRNPQRILYKAYAYFREKILQSMHNREGNQIEIDSFFMECFSFHQNSFRMQVEYTSGDNRFRDSVEINPGRNQLEIPFKKFQSSSDVPTGSIIVFPENDLDVRVVFSWLDFIRKKPVKKSVEIKPVPAEKVKCVAWDLDNTLWKGILIEDGAEKITIPEENIKCIKALDERGIIQTIVSKNDHDEAWKILERYNLQDYFIYPAINWGPKSANLAEIAKRINIGIDTFVLFDDSPFERAEVKGALPQVRVFDEKEINIALSRPEFDVPVSEAGKMRRLSYLTEIQREKVQQQYSGDITAFLKDCRMNMRIFVPTEPAHISRCLELIQRSNQLNLSSRRYSDSEFRELLSKSGVLCLGLHCSDRFGDYGIVGFASVDECSETPRLVDFVISCRVAQKRVEHTFINWLRSHEFSRGYKVLGAELIKTRKNGPLVKVFNDLPFSIIGETDEKISMVISAQNLKESEQIITIIDDTSGISFNNIADSSGPGSV
jgi:FkbH-like protein